MKGLEHEIGAKIDTWNGPTQIFPSHLVSSPNRASQLHLQKKLRRILLDMACWIWICTICLTVNLPKLLLEMLCGICPNICILKWVGLLNILSFFFFSFCKRCSYILLFLLYVIKCLNTSGFQAYNVVTFLHAQMFEYIQFS